MSLDCNKTINNFGFGIEPNTFQTFAQVYKYGGKWGLNKWLLTFFNINQNQSFRILVKQNAILYIPNVAISNNIGIKHKNISYDFAGIGVIPPVYEYVFNPRYTDIGQEPLVYIAFYFYRTEDNKKKLVTFLHPVYVDKRIKSIENFWKYRNHEDPVERLVANALYAYDKHTNTNKTFGNVFINIHELLNCTRTYAYTQELTPVTCKTHHIEQLIEGGFYKKDKLHEAQTICNNNAQYLYHRLNMAVIENNLYLPASLSPFEENHPCVYIHVDYCSYISYKLANKLSVYNNLKPLQSICNHVNYQNNVMITGNVAEVNILADRKKYIYEKTNVHKERRNC